MPSDLLMRSEPSVDRWLTAVAGNILVMAPLAYAAGLHVLAPDHYYAAVQEDAYVEWGSFWAFFLAAVVFIRVGVRQRRNGRRLPWFAFGLSVFCLFVAMEEISWGQRLIGYRPPTYFLEHNYQQELNVHNVMATTYRQLGVQIVIAGYGIVIPQLSLLRMAPPVLEKLGAVTVPLMFLPAFAVMLGGYVGYPFQHTGEWIELMVGLGFLFTGLVRFRALRDRRWRDTRSGTTTLGLVGTWLLVVGLGVSTAVASRVVAADNPRLVDATRIEVDALRRDFEAGLLRTHCGLHKRLYTFVEEYGERGLLTGEFAALGTREVPKQRAEFFLDPWNSPYWIRHVCESAATPQVVFLYSFGPNRRRDSTERAIGGDDIGWRAGSDSPTFR